MGVDAGVKTQSLTITGNGGISSDYGAIASDGVNGNLTLGLLIVAQKGGTVTTLTNGNTITPPVNQGVVRVTAAAAVTGIIIAAGTTGGQKITVIHEGAAANTITFAASGTSNVADGASDVITGPSARTYVWDSVTALWYAEH